MNKTYYLEHRGHYLGGVIFVVEQDIDKAKQLIKKELNSAGVAEFNIDKVKEVDLNKKGVTYLFNGDY